MIDAVDLLVLFVLGFGGGFISGLTGIGGGIIMVPLLAYVGGLPFHASTAISVAEVFAASLSGAYRHYRLGNVYVRVALIAGGVGALAAAVAAAFAPAIPAVWLEAAFFVLVVLSGILLLMPRRRLGEGKQPAVSTLSAVGFGILAGTVTGTLGVGGGFFLVPTLRSLFGFSTRMAIGTSLAIILLGSLSGVVTRFGTGQLDLAMAAVVVLGATLGAQLGAYASHRMPARALRLVLLLLLVGIAARTAASLAGLG